MLQPDAVAARIQIAELEEATSNEPPHAIGGWIEHPDRARLAIGDVDDAIKRGDAARLGEGRFEQGTIVDRFGARPRNRVDAMRFRAIRPDLMRASHRDPELIAAPDEVPGRGKRHVWGDSAFAIV